MEGLIGTHALMHARAVPGQRHDIAQIADQREQTVGGRVDGCDAMAHMRRDQLGLGDAKGLGKVARTRFLVFGPPLTDEFRGRALQHRSVGHVVSFTQMRKGAKTG